MQLLFFSFLLRFLFYGIRRGVNGVNGVNEVNGALFGVLGFLVGVVLFGSGWFCLGRGVNRGVKLLLSGRQNGDMWHRYGAVSHQNAVMKQ